MKSKRLHVYIYIYIQYDVLDVSIYIRSIHPSIHLLHLLIKLFYDEQQQIDVRLSENVSIY